MTYYTRLEEDCSITTVLGDFGGVHSDSYGITVRNVSYTRCVKTAAQIIETILGKENVRECTLDHSPYRNGSTVEHMIGIPKEEFMISNVVCLDNNSFTNAMIRLNFHPAW